MGNIENLKLKSYLKSPEVLKTWLDYLRLSFTQKIDFFEKIFDKLNTTNSNFVIIDELTYEKLYLPTGASLKISVSVNGLSVPIMLYNKFWKWIIASGYGRLDFYGMFFRLFELWDLQWSSIDWIKTYVYGKTSEIPWLTRLDYCFDMFYLDKKIFPSYTEFFPKGSINKKTKIYEIWTWESKESRSVGSKSAKRYVIRMYNKLLDVSSKGKQRFYGDYFTFQAVHRFEIQFWPHFTRWFTLETLDLLIFKVNVFLWLTDKSFEGLMFYKYDNKHDVTEFNKLFFTKTFVGKAQKFINSWYDPYSILYDYMITNVEKNIHYPMLYDMSKKIDKINDLSDFL